ncbi:diacylglycerol kinase family protein [Halalkalibacter sp. APA_J-10(15)]|uniref:diacylglycerol kinase family protein n=1 Tax=unclassified Halalkalibacter TaxID=2893063 RepID=UPI001FF4C903|nr:diacylglycerol kinase family protein [Halalkalibacter sp. APA_J-10(15)]MCK0471564.1 diacylglycerol kinase family protein [Halalkalibacter sp. APA_J-10(15)]
MDLQDRNRRGFKRLLKSFYYASQGLVYVLKHEQNMNIHFIVAIITLLSAYFLSVPLIHWLILLLVIAGMLALEIMNTAIERTVDLVTNEYHPLAKRAKDIAAAGVFIYCFFAVVIGILIFLPPLLELLS